MTSPVDSLIILKPPDIVRIRSDLDLLKTLHSAQLRTDSGISLLRMLLTINLLLVEKRGVALVVVVLC